MLQSNIFSLQNLALHVLSLEELLDGILWGRGWVGMRGCKCGKSSLGKLDGGERGWA